MRRLGKLLKLGRSDRRSLAEATFVVATIRIGLWLLPFQTVRNLVAKVSKGGATQPGKVSGSVDRVVWAVTSASRYIPRSSCLTQAMAVHVMLRRQGHECRLRIGIGKGESRDFRAHAWVESGGKVVIGGPEANLQRYTSLPALDS